jgi:cell pole-organizing protein PopZ
MPEAAKDSDQSMEDILQSIKRIIADEGEPAPAVAGSDVLELTELLAEDAAPPEVVQAVPADAEPTPVAPEISLDALMDEASAAPIEVVVAPEPAPAPEPQKPVVAPAVAPTPPAPVSSADIMSESTVIASMAALNALAHRSHEAPAALASPNFRSGITVEDLVQEALRPMLKDWLDKNLPDLVNQLVEREIRRISG